MRFNRPLFTTCVVAALLSPALAFAHAQLQKAEPGVGTTLQAPPASIRLAYSEPVEPAFCGVTLVDAAGNAVALGKPASAPGDKATLVVAVKGKLAPGTFTVVWHAVSVDTHRTQGKFSFTLAP